MSVALHTARLALPRAGAAALGAALCVPLLLRPALRGAGPEADATAVLWLHLPACIATLAALATGIELWPTLARERPGAATVARALGTRFAGAGAALLGCLGALALVLAALGAAFPLLLQVAGRTLREPRTLSHFTTEAGHPPLLTADRPRLLFQHADAQPIATLRLAPWAILGPEGDKRPVTLTLRAHGALPDPGKGEVLGTVTISGSRDPVELTFTPRRVVTLELSRAADPGIALAFPAGALLGLSASATPTSLASAFAALGYLAPALLFGAIALALRDRLALPYLQVLLLGTLATTVPFDLVPTSGWITALARGQTPWSGPQIAASAPSFSVALLAMILAMLRRSRPLA